jgi:hypothetical protein
MKRTLLFTSVLLTLCAIVAPFSVSQVPNPAPAHWPWTGVTPAPVPISASAIADSFGNPIANAKLCFSPVDANGNAVGFRVSQVQVMTKPVCGLVSNGALQAGLSLASTPSGIYYHPQVIDRATGAVLRDYCTTQITGSSWSLDSYDCATAPVPPPAAGAITPAATAELAIYCGSNPTSTLCGIMYQGLYDTGSTLTTSFTGSGAPSLTCDAPHLYTKYYDLAHLGNEYTCLDVSGSYAWQQTSGGASVSAASCPSGQVVGGWSSTLVPICVPSPTSVGATYSPTAVDVFGGDSIGVVENQNTDNMTAVACDGTSSATSCHGTATSTAFYHVGQWINMSGQITPGAAVFSPGCMEFSIVQVTQITGSTIYWSEPQTLTPGRAGCTGVVSGTGSAIQDASYFYPQQVATMPYLTAGGAMTPKVYNRAWPAQPLADTDANFSTYFGDLAPNVTGVAANFFYFSDDVCGTTSYPEPDGPTFVGHLQSIMSQAHAMGYNVILLTIPEGPSFNCGLTVGEADPIFWYVNAWTRGAQCGVNQPRTNCADQVVDDYSYGLNDRSNAYFVQQSGNFQYHLTNAGGTLLANTVNMAMIAKNSYNSGGFPGYGINQFNGLQEFNGGFSLPSTGFVTLGSDDSVNNIGAWRAAYSYWQWLATASECWTQLAASSGQPPFVCISADGHDGTAVNYTLSLNRGPYPSTTTAPSIGVGDGNWNFEFWYAHGVTTDPGCSAGMTQPVWYNSTTGQLKYCANGTVVALGASGGGSMTWPTLTGLAKFNGTGWATPTYADVIALFTGCTSANPYPRYDGTCGNPGGSGEVSTSVANTWTAQQTFKPAAPTGNAVVLQGASAGAATPAYVQGVKGPSGGAGTTLTGVAAGDAIFGICEDVSGGALSSPGSLNDSAGATYTSLGFTAPYWNTQWFLATNVAAGTHTSTSCGASGDNTIWLFEFSGVASTSPVDGSFGIGSNTAAAPAITTTAANDLVFSGVDCYATGGGTPTSSGAGFTAVLADANANIFVYNVAATTGTYTPAFAANCDNPDSFTVALKAAPASTQSGDLMPILSSAGAALGAIDANGRHRGVGVAVGSLGACTSADAYTPAYVNDAVSPNYLGALTGGGSVSTPVFCNGTAWVAY